MLNHHCLLTIAVCLNLVKTNVVVKTFLGLETETETWTK